MPDLEELRRAVFPTAAGGAPARGATALRDVVWVRVLKARVPAFDALDRGDLAILPETALRALAAGGLEPGAVVDALDRAEGAQGQAVAVHAPAGVPSAAADAAGYLANSRHVALRTPLPGPAAEASGTLVVLGAPPATELERLAGDRVAALLALELARDQAGRRPTEARRRADALPGDGPPWVVLMARQLVAGTETSLDERERLRERVARLAPARRLRLRGDAGSLELRVVVAAGGAGPLGFAGAPPRAPN